MNSRFLTTLGSVTSRCPFSERNKTLGVAGGGGTPYDGLYREAPPERGTFFRLQVYERVGISLVEAYKRVGNSVIWVCERAQRG